MAGQKPRIEELPDEVECWRIYRQIYQKKGVDIVAFYAALARDVEFGLSIPVRMEFRELCDAGCLPEILALLTFLLRDSPHLQQLWEQIAGDKNAREKSRKSLKAAARALEGIGGDLFARHTSTGDPASVRVAYGVSELKFFERFLGLGESLRSDTETRSPTEFCKYLISAYVKSMTGEFHDRCVSGLVGETVGPEDFVETAQAMWRFRNYERLDRYHHGFVELIVAMSVVIAHST
jgi:hypothetical protein